MKRTTVLPDEPVRLRACVLDDNVDDPAVTPLLLVPGIKMRDGATRLQSLRSSPSASASPVPLLRLPVPASQVLSLLSLHALESVSCVTRDTFSPFAGPSPQAPAFSAAPNSHPPIGQFNSSFDLSCHPSVSIRCSCSQCVKGSLKTLRIPSRMEADWQ
ncbi:hypothetical protein CORC01_01630 [Colletotrichum orchidophilum]|uniref:Uncharacterized protein n=1 Tax=Colletotrichum orchidophilum TaxID=1209926 RepID=A0A1G4BPP1_9PEZI|nr:uncharacterized protein CORC01_01630 [Colletotrichum orchidophilum]OHF03246.1 hypothetical protein CORC01_01630 [Colletotrichum orchidophilum]